MATKTHFKDTLLNSYNNLSLNNKILKRINKMDKKIREQLNRFVKD